MEDYKEKYEKALQRAKLIEQGTSDYSVATYIFPELVTHDARMMHFILAELQFLRINAGQDSDRNKILTDAINWLEDKHDGKKWIYEDVYLKEKEQVFQDGVDEVLENPQKYGLEKQGEQKPNPYSGTSFEYNGHVYGMCARDGGVEILIDSNLKAFVSLDKTETYPLIINETEPKFKVGDWIYHEISGNTVHINKIENGLYVSDEGATISLGRQNDWRIWTIRDAKDGDVLDDGDSMILFRKIGNCTWDDVIDYHIGFNHFDGSLIIQSGMSHYGKIDSTRFEPATKEQRELLFANIEKMGYIWDEKKGISRR